MTNKNNKEYEIVLSDEGKIESENNIFDNSSNLSTCIFDITCEPSSKELLLLEIKRIGGFVKSQTSGDNRIVALLNDEQVLAIKELLYVEKIELNSENEFMKQSTKADLDLTFENEKSRMNKKIIDVNATFNSTENINASLVNAHSSVSTFSVNNTANALSSINTDNCLTAEFDTIYVCKFLCPNLELWFTFETTSGNNYYHIFSSGSVDTIGTLYDANGNVVAHNDDCREMGNYFNFKIFEKLQAQKRYYFCVKLYGSAIGEFELRINKVCGGVNYSDATKHSMEFIKSGNNKGYYVCSDCGYKVKSPELQDQYVLTPDDYLCVVSAQQLYVHYEHYVKENNGAYREAGKTAQAQIMRFISSIRRKDDYDNKYDYSDGNGKCYGSETVNNHEIHISLRTATLSDIAAYNGTYELFNDLILGYYAPKISLAKSIVNLLVEETNPLDFAALAADVYGCGQVSVALSIASNVVGFITTNMRSGDYIVKVNAGPYHGRYVYSPNCGLKLVKLVPLAESKYY